MGGYNLGEDVPFTLYSWGTGVNCDYREHTVISDYSRGQLRPVWAMLDSHYRRRRNRSVPYIQRMAQAVHPEGGGDYGRRTDTAPPAGH